MPGLLALATGTAVLAASGLAPARTTAVALSGISVPDHQAMTTDADRRAASMALDASGYPVIAYTAMNYDLRILHCNDPDCEGNDDSITAPDTAGDVGAYPSLHLDPSGFPVVAYVDRSNRDLKILHCNDANCAGGDDSTTAPDSAGSVGDYASLALDASGLPVVSYYDATNQKLKVLHCNDSDCAGGDESIETPDSSVRVGEFTSVKLDANGYPVVAYYDRLGQSLKLMHCNDVNCSGLDENIVIVDPGNNSAGEHSSLVLDANGFPVVSYLKEISAGSPPRYLAVLHCNDANCAGGDDSISVPFVGTQTAGDFNSIALDHNGRPVVTFFDKTGFYMRMLHCNDADCAGSDDTSIVPAMMDKGFTTLTLDGDGFPVVSYLYSNNLVLLHCGSETCDADADGVLDGSDNCAPIVNPDQLNNDGNSLRFNNFPYLVDDSTLARSDAFGDACDPDDDNDGLPDATETNLGSLQVVCASATAGTDPMKLDTDGDRITDGAECALGSDPANAASKPAIPSAADDTDHDQLSDAFEATIGTDPNLKDTDGDGLQDGWEYKGYGSNPLVVDTDGDVVTDGCEVASINADAVVNPGDQALLSAEVMRNVSLTGIPKLANFDLNKDGAINPGDQAFQASKVGGTPTKCPNVTL